MHVNRARPRRFSTPPYALSLALAAQCLACAPIALAQHDEHATEQREDDRAGREARNLLVFVGAKYEELGGLSSDALDDTEATPSADFFFSRSANRFRILAEYLLTDDEHELERLQAGWQVSETTRLWVGRFHQSASHWNTEHHHGQFLQTSLTRPPIEEFEDESGVLPSHTTGLLLERQQQFGTNAGLDLSFSAGLTTVLGSEGLEPFDLLDPDGGHGNGITFRIGFLPDLLGDDQFGFAYGRHNINVQPGAQLPASWSPGIDKIELEVASVYLDWVWPKWRLTATANYVESMPRGPTDGPRTDFLASYAQPEYHFNAKWIAYGRIEETSGTQTYLDIFPAYIRRQSLVGGKRLIGSKHAVSLELAKSEIADDKFDRVAVQWSAVLP
jgi:hypothetical protein